ncbi:hypothetical protein EV121DRAFT_260442 [Schizophyllum commune]
MPHRIIGSVLLVYLHPHISLALTIHHHCSAPVRYLYIQHPTVALYCRCLHCVYTVSLMYIYDRHSFPSSFRSRLIRTIHFSSTCCPLIPDPSYDEGASGVGEGAATRARRWGPGEVVLLPTSRVSCCCLR